MDSTCYILDTNAIRAINYDLLRHIAAKSRLGVSPLTIYEFLSHLDERGKKEKGGSDPNLSHLHKKNILKCGLVQLFDDPFAQHAEEAGARSCVHQTRFEDRIVLRQVIAALESSTTLNDFYSRKVSYPTGEVGEVRGVCERTRKALDEEEQKYQAYVTKYCRAMLEGLGFERSQSLTPDDFFQIAVDAAFGLASSYKAQIPSVEEMDLDGKVFTSIYIYVGYCIARAVEYLEKAHGEMESLSIDKNDMEDSALCLYLNLLENRVLVTNDGGSIRAITKSLINLKLKSDELGLPLSVLPNAINVEEFKQIACPEPC